MRDEENDFLFPGHKFVPWIVKGEENKRTQKVIEMPFLQYIFL